MKMAVFCQTTNFEVIYVNERDLVSNTNVQHHPELLLVEATQQPHLTKFNFLHYRTV